MGSCGFRAKSFGKSRTKRFDFGAGCGKARRAAESGNFIRVARNLAALHLHAIKQFGQIHDDLSHSLCIPRQPVRIDRHCVFCLRGNRTLDLIAQQAGDALSARACAAGGLVPSD